jgi:hypothetical protein
MRRLGRKIRDHISDVGYVIFISAAALVVVPVGLLAFFVANGIMPARSEDEGPPYNGPTVEEEDDNGDWAE